MLNVILYIESETEISTETLKRLKGIIVEAGGELKAFFSSTPPTMDEIFSYKPDIVIASGVIDGRMWSFLLRLKQFRLQGKKWPKIICPNLFVQGRYEPRDNVYIKNEMDPYVFFPPYNTLSDIYSEFLFHELEVCFSIIEVEYLKERRGITKKWLLKDGLLDYGELTFDYLHYSRAVSWPLISCHFEPFPSFVAVKNFFYDDIFQEGIEHQNGFPGHPQHWQISYEDQLNLFLQPIENISNIDTFFKDTGTFQITILENAARVYILNKAVDYSRQI